jgi:DNA-binding HxlR family transcriptional regulator
MSSHGQFCAVARALELLGERWTLLVVRELLMGSQRFGDIRRGIPRISKTMLSERLRTLEDAGVVMRHDEGGTPTYVLTPAGEELSDVVRSLGVWGQRWARWAVRTDERDEGPLLWDVQRRVDRAALPETPVVVRFELRGAGGRAVHFLLLRRTEVSLCADNPGLDVEVRVRASREALVEWWRGDTTWREACASGAIEIEGPAALVRAFPRWFHRYLFADVAPARRA